MDQHQFYSRMSKIGIITCLASFTIAMSACSLTKHEPNRATHFNASTPCPFEAAQGFTEARITCGYLDAPENRSVENSSRIRIPVAIIRAQNPNPALDPVVFLHGGPGAAPLASVPTYQLFASHLFGTQRDIIIYNQRGSSMGEPALDCTNIDQVRTSAYTADYTLAERDALISDVAIKCLRTLNQEGRDLRGYSSVENAHDLRELRELLGIKQWNLMAVSYGTIMAIEAARLDPKGVRSLILDSIVSPQSDLFMSEANRNYTRAINRLLNACATDSECAEAFPDLSNTLDELINALHTKPITLIVAGKDGEDQIEVVVNWHDFFNLTHWMLYNTKTLRLIPLLIDSTQKGDLTTLTYLSENVFPAPKNTAPTGAGAFFAIVCQDQYTSRNPLSLPTDQEQFRGFSIVSFMPEVCAKPDIIQSQSELSKTRPLAPFHSDIPTLLLSGHFDPMTPDLYAEDVEKTLSNVTRLVIPDYGHSTLSGYTACQTQLANAFLNDLEDKSEFPCLNGLSTPDFAVSLAEAFKIFGL